MSGWTLTRPSLLELHRDSSYCAVGAHDVQNNGHFKPGQLKSALRVDIVHFQLLCALWVDCGHWARCVWTPSTFTVGRAAGGHRAHTKLSKALRSALFEASKFKLAGSKLSREDLRVRCFQGPACGFERLSASILFATRFNVLCALCVSP